LETETTSWKTPHRGNTRKKTKKLKGRGVDTIIMYMLDAASNRKIEDNGFVPSFESDGH
jgi:hypothetical protein